jgi:hypothetical protein
MADVTPEWSENNVIPQAVILDGDRRTGSLDLRGKHGAYVLPRVGRRFLGGATLTRQPRVIVTRRGSEIVSDHRAYVLELFAVTTTHIVALVISEQAVDDTQIGLSQVYATGDVLIIHAAGTIIPASSEWNKVLRLQSTTTHVLEAPLRFPHGPQPGPTERVVNQAVMYMPTWLPGGSIYDIAIFNNDPNERIVAQVQAQVYDNDLIV